MANTTQRSALTTWLFDPLRPTSARAEYQPKIGKALWGIPTLIGIACLVASLVGWSIDAPQFYFSYLVGWVFCVALSVGALFIVVIQHLTRAKWSVTVRRIPEALTWSFPLLAVLSIPVVIGMHDLFHWTHQDLYDPASPEYDAVIAGKQGYLNTPFFLARLVIYFVLWSYLSYRLYSLSIRQDVDPAREIPALQRRVSAWGLPVLAVTTAFSSYDFLMSLDPHWFSTIFGVYFFGGAFWTGFAFIAFTTILLQRNGMLRHAVTGPHYLDVGRFMFGFTVFWAYIAFSQYMLIWYGNLPEETIWFRHRLEHGWGTYSAILLLGHFVVPFWVLISQAAKRNKAIMALMAVWFFLMQWLDLFWISMPVLHTDATLHWLDLTCWLGLFGLVLGAFFYRMSRHSLLPQNDPYLAKSLSLA